MAVTRGVLQSAFVGEPLVLVPVVVETQVVLGKDVVKQRTNKAKDKDTLYLEASPKSTR